MFSKTGLYKCATCGEVCAEPEALRLTEVERFQKLLALANQWLRNSSLPDGNAFMPDIAGDKIAKTRTEACARELLRALSGIEEP